MSSSAFSMRSIFSMASLIVCMRVLSAKDPCSRKSRSSAALSGMTCLPLDFQLDHVYCPVIRPVFLHPYTPDARREFAEPEFGGEHRQDRRVDQMVLARPAG